MLCCGSCRTEICESYGILYRLDWVDGELVYPDKFQNYDPPNTYVCDTCWKSVPADAASPDGYYLYASAVRQRYYPTDFADAVKLTGGTVWKHLRATLPIIADMATRCESPATLLDNAFKDRVIAYLSKHDLSVHAMKEFAPGMIAVNDTYAGNREFDLYFDIERWTATSDSDVTSKVRGQDLGILPGVARFPSPWNFSQLQAMGKRHLKPLKGDVWADRMGYVAVPKNLRAAES